MFQQKEESWRNANAAAKCAERDVLELLKGVKFSVDKNGQDLYIKAVEKLQLYTSTTYKNGADVHKSLKQEKMITSTTP